MSQFVFRSDGLNSHQVAVMDAILNLSRVMTDHDISTDDITRAIDCGMSEGHGYLRTQLLMTLRAVESSRDKLGQPTTKTGL